MKLSCEGLVIWQTKTGEANKVITILTKNGIITAYAQNALRPKSKLASATALFTYSDFELFSNGKMYNVDEAVCVNRFPLLLSDVANTALASYFCEILKYIAPIDDDASEYLSLMMNSLFLLSEKQKEILCVKAVFELRCLAMAGYMPDLVACGNCAASDDREAYFDFSEGSWLCGKCALAAGKPPNISAPVLKAMRHIIYSDSKSVFSFSLTEPTLKNLSQVCEKYLLWQIDREITTLDYFKTIYF